MTHVAKSNIQGITISQYEQTLSLNPSGSLLQRHQTIIRVSITKEIESGVEQDHVEWDDCETDADAKLEIIHSQKHRKWRPVVECYTIIDHEKKFGCIETNGLKYKSRRYDEPEGERKSRVPSEGPTIVEEIEHIDSRMALLVGDSSTQSHGNLRALQSSFSRA